MLFETLYIVYLSFLLAKPCSSFTLPNFLKRIQGPPLLRSDGVESRSQSAPGALLALPINELQNGTINEGQALIDSWLGRRATCNLGYYLCRSGTLCCANGYCCTDINTCVADQGGGCCGSGTCAAGWSCCESVGCYPLNGQCCSTGMYCEVGNECVMVSGKQQCCTDVSCTAYVSSGITIYVTTSSSSTYSSTSSQTTTTTTSSTASSSPAVSTPSSSSSSSNTQPGGQSTGSNTNSYSGFSTGDKIALGCGIGIGLPATLATVWMCLRNRS
ncbi:uncharacterized protein K444DRAFT_612441 [Hyaloscypha bicolor E]|uniref:Carbohydrate-binding module family 18 protein n=1 Tax=Hyaloscypha bicolor E TaxID=1095630 RepID=A0A2J6TCJ5_9HELO|nr:uncharacterized protein K444DRAFT_612441 [Hyaloscypha bicolor E]PMD60754.1 hypothetical protein K444DRAFT_612441 [Hyaloscypha bicolor E]